MGKGVTFYTVSPVLRRPSPADSVCTAVVYSTVHQVMGVFGSLHEHDQSVPSKRIHPNGGLQPPIVF